jgi:alkanesulfonate monooxygenase SsuD/methylene tetrahydromethanopterin reductase-like flavin-dependent oxidoreductase (luciferase family)
MQIGIDSFIATLADPVTGALVDPAERLRNLLEEVELADRVGLDVFGIGEHHRKEFLDSAPGRHPGRCRSSNQAHPSGQRGDGSQCR